MFCTRPSWLRKSILAILVVVCCCVGVSAEIVNPQCSKNVCVLPPNECVEFCPTRQKHVYFSFGLRSNKKCAPVSSPRKALHGNNDTSVEVLSIKTPPSSSASSNNTKDLAERRDLWPEYGPPDCFWGLCQFEGPVCILWCTEDHVYYGSDDGCKEKRDSQQPAVSGTERSLDSAAFVVFAVALLGTVGFPRAVTGSIQVC